jgi:radical SAM-linked protein
MDGEAETARKQALLADLARARRVALKMHENVQSHVEGIFSRGDRRVAEILETAFRLGCRFDGWDEALRIDLWDQAIAETAARTGVDVQTFLGTIPVTARLPWDHIDIGLEPDFLLKEYKKALKDRLSPPCGKPYKKLLHPNNVADAEAASSAKLICYDCGIACDLDEMKRERLFYLRRMNAWQPAAARPAVTPPPAADAAASATPRAAGPKRPAPPVRASQGEARRYRLRYTKLGRVAFLGHLDLVRHLPRIFRRAGLEIFYSVGFHPKPELSFGPALGLGIPSLGELVDVTLVDDLDPGELLERLAPVSLDGVAFLHATRLGNNDRALGRVVSEAEYLARLPRAADVERALARWASPAPLTAMRAPEKAGGVGRTVDVRRTLRALEVCDDAALGRPFDWPVEEAPSRTVRIRVAVSAEGGARPREIVDALCGDGAAADTDFARLALYADGRADPLQVVAPASPAASAPGAVAAAALP